MIKRWLTGFGITAYLGTLLFGIVSHAANYQDGSHPSMYFLAQASSMTYSRVIGS